MVSRHGDEGFTLVEMIAVVAIIAIIMALAIPSYSAYIRKGRIKRAIAEMHMLEIQINSYKTSNDHLPAELIDIGSGGGIPDPWGHPYQYLNIADGGNTVKGKLRRDKAINPLNSDYDLFSMGADGVYKNQLDDKDSLDDIVRARDGAFIGLSEDFNN